MGGVISQILFQPPKPSYNANNPNLVWLDCKTSPKVNINNKESFPKIPALYLDYKGSDLCILYSHGNATDLGQVSGYLDMLRTKLRINICGYEYQGYGISKPSSLKPSELGVYSSIDAAVNYVVNQKKIKHDKIILFGTSLGGGATIDCALKATKKGTPFRGVITQSTFTSVMRIKTPFSAPMFDMFENCEKIDKIDVPIFILHGKVDKVVPFNHAKTLHSKIKNKYDPTYIDNAGHNNIVQKMTIDGYVRKIYDFIVYLNKFHKNRKLKQMKQENIKNGIKTSQKTNESNSFKYQNQMENRNNI